MLALAYVSESVPAVAGQRPAVAVMAALSDLGLGLITLDAHGRVAEVGPAALRVMADDLRIELGRPRARGPGVDRALQRLIAAADGRLLILSRDGGCLLMIDATALPAGGVLLLLRRPGAETCRSQVALAEAFGLTAAETRVALAAATGKGGPVIAGDLDVSLSTVRTHLKAVFAKTGTRSQAHLAAIFAPILVT